MKKTPSVILIAAFFIIIAGLYLAATIITQILMAVFISIICYAPIAWLLKMKVPKIIAVSLVLISIIAITLAMGGIIGSSFSSFSENLPKYTKNLNEMSQEIREILVDRGITISLDQFSGITEPAKIMSLTAKVLGQLGSFMGNALMIFFLVLFLLLEVDSISDKIKATLHGTKLSVSYLLKIGTSIRHYLSIKTVTSLLTGGLIWILMLMIGVDYAVLWGLLAFLLNYIPNIGSIIAGIPPLLFAFLQMGFGGVVWTFMAFVAVNLIIGNVVEPKMMGRGMGLSTFVVFLALLFWGFILGTVGMFLSIPLTMAIKIMLEQDPETEWIAVLLGTTKDAQAFVEKNKPTIPEIE